MTKVNTLDDELIEAATQMVNSLNSDELVESEVYEWYGYLRALRDLAHFTNSKHADKINNMLQDALALVRDWVAKA